MKNYLTMGLDIGYSNLCIVSGKMGAASEKLFPVGVTPVNKGFEHLQGNKKNVEVLVDGKPFYAMVDSDLATTGERQMSKSYIHSSTYRALYNAALKSTGRGTIDQVVTGLPVDQYRDPEIRNKLIEQLQGVHEVAQGAQVVVKRVDVLPQAYGAYIAAMSQQGVMELFGKGTVLVVDPGFFSVDWVTICRHNFQPEFSGSSTEATSKILEHIKEAVTAKTGYTTTIEQLEIALRNNDNEILLGSELYDFSNDLENASAVIAPAAVDAIDGKIRSSRGDINFIVLAGGAAKLYEKAVAKRFPKSKIINLPTSVMGNARGFHQYSFQFHEEK